MIEVAEESERPVEPLIGPGTNRIGEIEQSVFAMGGCDGSLATLNFACVGREESGEAFKERCLTCAVGTDESEDFTISN